MRRKLIALAILGSLAGVSGAVAAEDAKTPPKADNGDAMKADPKTGTSPPTQAGGAGVEGKSDAGSGETKTKDKQ